jgi:hypothetical protein
VAGPVVLRARILPGMEQDVHLKKTKSMMDDFKALSPTGKKTVQSVVNTNDIVLYEELRSSNSETPKSIKRLFHFRRALLLKNGITETKTFILYELNDKIIKDLEILKCPIHAYDAVNMDKVKFDEHFKGVVNVTEIYKTRERYRSCMKSSDCRKNRAIKAVLIKKTQCRLSKVEKDSKELRKEVRLLSKQLEVYKKVSQRRKK